MSDDDKATSERATKAAATREANKSKCATDGCGHLRTEHDANLTTCWGDGPSCPCTGYTHPQDD